MQANADILDETSPPKQSFPQRKTKPDTSDADRKIGIRIHIAREETCLTRLEVANVLEITQQQIEKYEKGQNRISARTLFILSKLFRKPMTWFTQDLENKNNKNLLIKHNKNRLAFHTIKIIGKIKDKPTQDKIIRIIKIITEKET